MANLTLKNIPAPLYERLKETARLNHRSLNGEMIACLEKVLMPQRIGASEHIATARALRKKISVEKLDAQEIINAEATDRS